MKTSNRTFPYLSHGTAVLLCSMTVVLCMLCTPAKAQQFGQWDLDMYSTSMYINPSGNNYAEVTCMTAFSGSVASSWTPYSNDYCITPVGAAYAAGIGYANGYIDGAKQGLRRVSPGGGLGEPGEGLPIGDVPIGLFLLLAAVCALYIRRKTIRKKARC